MDLDTLIVAVFCLVDDEMTRLTAGQRLRERGPHPVLYDSEVLTMEAVGEYLGLDQDKAIFCYFRRHYGHFFPRLRHVHRTTFVRQAANLWACKERLWQHLTELIPHDETLAIVDSFPVPVCQFARAYRCHGFRGQAAYGHDELARQTFYGFRCHVRLCWPGIISRFDLAPANAADLAVLPELVEGTAGQVIGDRNYWSPKTKSSLAEQGLELLAPYRTATKDPWPHWSRLLSRIRYGIDTVFGQLAARYHAKKVWARDLWHLTSRFLRKILSHTIAVLLWTQAGGDDLRIENLLA